MTETLTLPLSLEQFFAYTARVSDQGEADVVKINGGSSPGLSDFFREFALMAAIAPGIEAVVVDYQKPRRLSRKRDIIMTFHGTVSGVAMRVLALNGAYLEQMKSRTE